MIKAKIRIKYVEEQEAMQVLNQFHIIPFKIRSSYSWNNWTSFWIEISDEEKFFQVITLMNQLCNYGGAIVLKKKTIKTF